MPAAQSVEQCSGRLFSTQANDKGWQTYAGVPAPAAWHLPAQTLTVELGFLDGKVLAMNLLD